LSSAPPSGSNLVGIRQLLPEVKLSAIEIKEAAVAELLRKVLFLRGKMTQEMSGTVGDGIGAMAQKSL
jgi:hypothetical protein